jgi:hypothetical protein
MSKVRKGFAWTNKMSARRFTLLRFTPRPRFFTRGTGYFKSAVSRLSFGLLADVYRSSKARRPANVSYWLL